MVGLLLQLLGIALVDMIVALLVWVLIFGAVALAAGAFHTRTAFRRLGPGGSSPITRAAVLALLCLVMPMTALWLGVGFAVQRGAAAALDNGGEAVSAYAFDVGAERARAQLGLEAADNVLDLLPLRTSAAQRQTYAWARASEDGDVVERFEALAETVAFGGIVVALETLPQDARVTWTDVATAARPHALDLSGKLFAQASGAIRQSAWVDAAVLFALLAIAHGAAFAFVRWHVGRVRSSS